MVPATGVELFPIIGPVLGLLLAANLSFGLLFTIVAGAAAIAAIAFAVAGRIRPVLRVGDCAFVPLRRSLGSLVLQGQSWRRGTCTQANVDSCSKSVGVRDQTGHDHCSAAI
jgi:hypothetical protein